MSVKSKHKKNKLYTKLYLELDHGDLDKLDQAMDKWSFKDYQSFLRFAVSLFILNESKSFSIKIDGFKTDVVPVEDLLTTPTPPSEGEVK